MVLLSASQKVMTADALDTQGAKSSAAIVLTMHRQMIAFHEEEFHLSHLSVKNS